eukprot:978702-Lingulodinium_polyedra.AAC.1
MCCEPRFGAQAVNRVSVRTAGMLRTAFCCEPRLQTAIRSMLRRTVPRAAVRRACCRTALCELQFAACANRGSQHGAREFAKQRGAAASERICDHVSEQLPRGSCSETRSETRSIAAAPRVSRIIHSMR